MKKIFVFGDSVSFGELVSSNKSWPSLLANTKNIYQILKNILDDSKILERYKEEGPKFISKFYDPKKKAKILQKKLLEL
mgnify:CR=1 FL=1